MEDLKFKTIIHKLTKEFVYIELYKDNDDALAFTSNIPKLFPISFEIDIYKEYLAKFVNIDSISWDDYEVVIVNLEIKK
jgi:flagellar assembly factor FliW